MQRVPSIFYFTFPFAFLPFCFYFIWMFYLWASLLVLLNAFWLMLGLFALPGNWLIVISTVLFAWWQWDSKPFSIATLVIIVVLAIAGELIEFFAGALGAKTTGGSRRSALGAILGGIAGAITGTFLIPVPPLGTLIGACIGACIGALCMELTTGRKLKEAAVSGLGAGLGQFLGVNAKFLLGIAIWLIVAIAAFIP